MALPKPVKLEVERYVGGLSQFEKIDNPIKLSQETRKCYQMLREEGKSLGNLLRSVTRELEMARADIFHAAVSSINVEVPGR